MNCNMLRTATIALHYTMGNNTSSLSNNLLDWIYCFLRYRQKLVPNLELSLESRL